MKDLDDWKQIIGALLGASIAVVWIVYAILLSWNYKFIVIPISLTILLGTLSGGLYQLSKEKCNWKQVVGELLGASIPVAWIVYAILDPGNMILLVVALALTIIFGTLAGGFLSLSKKD